MAPGLRSDGSGQVPIEVGIACSRDMRAQVRLPSGIGIHEIETAVDHGQPRLAEQFPQRVDADQSMKFHESQLSATPYELHPLQLGLWHSLFIGAAAALFRGAYSWPWNTRGCRTNRSCCTSTSKSSSRRRCSSSIRAAGCLSSRTRLTPCPA